MRCLVIFLFILNTFSLHAQLWVEDFSGEANGATSGTAGGTLGGTWSVTTTPSGTFSKVTLLGEGFFRADQTVTEGVWSTNNIDISGTGMATISVELLTAFTNSSDYIRAYYKVDGGSEILFAELLGQLGNISTTGSAIVSGSTLQVVVRSNENTAGSIFGVPFSMGLDDLSVTSVPVVYSRKNGNWSDNNATTGTWSTTGFTGLACGCIPTTGQVALIGNAFTVDLDVSSSVGGVEIQNTGTLRYNTSAQSLTITQGLARVKSGGAISSSSGAITGEQLIFNGDVGGANFQIDSGGSATLEDFVLGTSASNLHYISGDGTLAITDDLIINADNATLINNLTTSLSIADRVEFASGTNDSEFENNSTFSAVTLFFDDDNNFITNNSTLAGAITVNSNADDGNSMTNSATGTFNLSTINLNDGNFTINNSGTINQTGNFTNIDTGSNGNFNNLASGIWNWTLTPNTTYDTDMATVLDCAASGNTFNYSAAGAQRIIPVQYSNLTLSNSGAKDSNNANISVNGNWLVSGSASFTEGTGTVTFNGAVAQSITSTGTETFNNLAINNTFATSPQLTLNNGVTVTGTLTMTDGNINLNTNTFTIGVSAASTGTLSHGGASTNGWMYGGTLRRFMAASNATTIGGGDQNEGFFPLGGTSDFRPFFVGKNNNAGTGGSISVTHNNLTTTSTVAFAESITRRHDANWAVTTSGITGGTWDLRAGGTTFGTIQELADLRMSTSSGVVGTHAVATGSIADPRVNRTGLTFSQLTNNFHLASTDATNSPLPVVLLYFKANVFDAGVTLSWKTASELNNDYFTIERSSDGESFIDILNVKGKGTTNQPSTYSLVDYNPIVGKAYYRLKQVDFDGTISYSELELVEYIEPELPVLNIYPNPFNGQHVAFELLNIKATEEVPIAIINEAGVIVNQFKLKPLSNGRIVNTTLEFKIPLSPGIYILKVGDNSFITTKLVVK